MGIGDRLKSQKLFCTYFYFYCYFYFQPFWGNCAFFMFLHYGTDFICYRSTTQFQNIKIETAQRTKMNFWYIEEDLKHSLIDPVNPSKPNS